MDLYKAFCERVYYKDGHLYYKDTGERAGRKHNKGYWQVYSKGKRLLLHRVIFFYHHKWLPEQVDHIDRDKSNCRIDNLRASDNSLNQHNTDLRKDSSTGYEGVSAHGKRYRAYINWQGKRHNIGTFDTALEAHEKRELYKHQLISFNN